MQLPENYRHILKTKLDERCNVNPRYSLRAFARDIGFSPSRLSDVINGKKGLSEKSALQVCKKLGYNSQETKYFCSLVIASDARSKTQRRNASTWLEANQYNRNEMKIINMHEFKNISDWYYYAILELITCKGFKSDFKWIAKKLDISIHQVKLAIERLKNLNLIEERDNKLVSTGINLSTVDGIPSEAIQKFNRQILEKASQAIVLQELDKRDFSTLTFAIPKTQIPKLKKKIENARNALIADIEDMENKMESDEVYMLSFQLFALTKENMT